MRLAGVQIGRVTGVDLPPQPGGKVRVDSHDRRGSSPTACARTRMARIETQGLLGDKIDGDHRGHRRRRRRVKPGDVIARATPSTSGRVMAERAEMVKSVSALADSFARPRETLNQSGLIEEPPPP